MRGLSFCTGVLLVSLWSGASFGAGPRDTADVNAAGVWEMGVFNPLRLGVGAGVELEAHPLFFFAAPHLLVRKGLTVPGDSGWRLALSGGAWLPTPALQNVPPRGLKGYFTPTCDVMEAEPEREHRCQQPGWIVVPQVGFAASKGREEVITVKGDLSAGVLLSGHRPRPLDTLAPLDLQMAPVFNQFRVHGVFRYDRPFGDRVRGHLEGHLYHRGAPEDGALSPLAMAAHVGADVSLGARWTLAFGVYYWNTDQGAVAIESPKTGPATLKRLRSHDFFPTFDLIWRGGDGT